MKNLLRSISGRLLISTLLASLLVLSFAFLAPVKLPEQVVNAEATIKATEPTKVIPVAAVKAASASTTVKAPTKTTVKSDAYTDSLTSLQNLGASYGITIGIDAPSSNSIGSGGWQPVTRADQDNLIAYSKLLRSEWSKYPVSFIHSTGLKHLYLVKQLQVGGQYRAAMPEPTYDNAVYYDIGSQYLADPTYVRNVIHHEFDHLIEYNLYGSYSWDDTAWKGCNTSDFTYGNGGWTAYADPTYANTKHPRNGFVTGYGTYGIEEDKAEIYAELMMNASNINKLIKQDSNLACKVTLYRQYMANLGLSL